MADQVGSGMMARHSAESGQLTPAAAAAPATTSHHGRPVSWVAVSIIMAAFLVGGFGLILGPTWWLFWVGAGMAAVGGLLALATDIFDDWY
jgi:fatty acid desaturase